MADAPDSVIIEIPVSASADESWTALREPARILRWFGWDADSLREEVDYIFVDHVDVDETARVIRFQGMPDRFEVEAVDDGRSVVRLVRAGSPRTTADWESLYDDMVQGWITFVQQLGFTLERHPDDARRTLYLTGIAADAAAPLPSAALGFGPLREGKVGERYELDVAGERLAGTVRFVTALQTGLTVDGWGDGLLVLVDRPTTVGNDVAGGWAVFTTYGLDNAAFAAFENRWKRWWGDHYPADRPGFMETPPPEF